LRAARFALAVSLAAGLAAPAPAFNPTPRPAPVFAVCSDHPVFTDPGEVPAPGDECFGSLCGSGGSCVASPGEVDPAVGVRGTLTLITDEDVTGWNDGIDLDPSRRARARLTALLQYERDGALRTFADTYDQSELGVTCAGSSELPPEELLAFLCIPAEPGGWSQPAVEPAIISELLNIQWTIPGQEMRKAILGDLLATPTPPADQHPFIEIIDYVGAISAHPDTYGIDPGTGDPAIIARDPLASARQVKVTIRVTRAP